MVRRFSSSKPMDRKEFGPSEPVAQSTPDLARDVPAEESRSPITYETGSSWRNNARATSYTKRIATAAVAALGIVAAYFAFSMIDRRPVNNAPVGDSRPAQPAAQPAPMQPNAAPQTREPAKQAPSAPVLEYNGTRFEVARIKDYTPEQLERIASRKGITGIYEALFGKVQGNIYKTPEMAALANALDYKLFVRKGSRGDKNSDGINDYLAKGNVSNMHAALTAEQPAVEKASIDDVVDAKAVANASDVETIVDQQYARTSAAPTYDALQRNGEIYSKSQSLITKRTYCKDGKVRFSYDRAGIQSMALQYGVTQKHAKRLVRKAALELI